jgi:hypothetical protein
MAEGRRGTIGYALVGIGAITGFALSILNLTGDVVFVEPAGASAAVAALAVMLTGASVLVARTAGHT